MFKWGILAICLFGIGFLGFAIVREFKPDPNSTAQTVLSLSTNNLNPSVDETFDIAINIETGTNTVSEALISLNFDNNLAKYVSLDEASGFGIDSESVDVNSEGVEFRIKADNSDYTGSGTIARMRLKSVAPGYVMINYGNRTIVGAASELGENVLLETFPIEINIK